MGRIIVTEFVSMDGVMQAPGGEEFKYPGWTFEFGRGDDGDDFKYQEAVEAEAHLLGRVTYESFAGDWPERQEMPGKWGEFARKLTTDPKYVVSTTLENPEWENVTVLDAVTPPHRWRSSRRRSRARSSSRTAVASRRS